MLSSNPGTTVGELGMAETTGARVRGCEGAKVRGAKVRRSEGPRVRAFEGDDVKAGPSASAGSYGGTIARTGPAEERPQPIDDQRVTRPRSRGTVFSYPLPGRVPPATHSRSVGGGRR